MNPGHGLRADIATVWLFIQKDKHIQTCLIIQKVQHLWLILKRSKLNILTFPWWLNAGNVVEGEVECEFEVEHEV